MDLAKQVASATAALVMQAKTVASRSNDQAVQNQVIASATQCALSTSQLVACTKVSCYVVVLSKLLLLLCVICIFDVTWSVVFSQPVTGKTLCNNAGII